MHRQRFYKFSLRGANLIGFFHHNLLLIATHGNVIAAETEQTKSKSAGRRKN